MVAVNLPNPETSNKSSSTPDSPSFEFKQKKKSPTTQKRPSIEKKKLNFREPEELVIKLNVYDLVWDKNVEKPQNAGLADLGLGFYHTGVELWGKEISFGQSTNLSSGVFAVRPRTAETLMHHTHFRKTIEIDTIQISRYSVDKILNRLALKYRSENYNILRCNCNHFTEELCTALCGKSIPEWVNRPANLGATAMMALSAPINAVNSVFSFLAPPQPVGDENQPPDSARQQDRAPDTARKQEPAPDSARKERPKLPDNALIA